MLTVALVVVIIALLASVRHYAVEVRNAKNILRVEEQYSASLEKDIDELEVKAEAYDFVIGNIYVKAIFDQFFRIELNSDGEIEIHGVNGLNLMVPIDDSGIPERYKAIEQACREEEAKKVPVILTIDDAKKLAADAKLAAELEKEHTDVVSG